MHGQAQCQYLLSVQCPAVLTCWCLLLPCVNVACMQFAGEVSSWPEETLEAVHKLWLQHDRALPVHCMNKVSHVRVDGLFKIIDGHKKIITAAGQVIDPVEFERLGDRSSSRNWQMSICVSGEYLQGPNPSPLNPA